jgi:hypothetical protein
MKRLLGLLAIAALLGGCATYALTGSGPISAEDKSYSVTLPQNWVRLTNDSGRVVVTRDGFGLQRIMIARAEAKDAFPKIKKAASDKLLASELAELQIAELKANGGSLANLAVLENLPAKVGGRTGFRLRIRILNDDGLAFDRVYCGVLDKGHYYLISFHAPELYYFDKYLPDFDRTLASFKLS